MTKKLVLFDFDGTLTRCDTLPLFLHFVGKGRLWYTFPILLYTVLLHTCGFLSAQEAKEKLFMIVFAKKSQKELEDAGSAFAKYLLNKKERFFRHSALECLKQHKNSGDCIYIVSASLALWVAPLAHMLGVRHIATECLFTKGQFSGKFHGENCNGAEKVRRIHQEVSDFSSYTHITAYGDSKGDLPMLALANDVCFKPFR